MKSVCRQKAPATLSSYTIHRRIECATVNNLIPLQEFADNITNLSIAANYFRKWPEREPCPSMEAVT